MGLDLGSALLAAGELERSEAVLTDVIERAREAGGVRTERHAWFVRGMLRVFNRPDRIDVAAALRETEESLDVLQAAGDELALAHAMLFLTTLYTCSSVVSQLDAAEWALQHAKRAGSRMDEAWSLSVIAFTLCDSPIPADEGVRICEGLLRELKSDPLGAAQITASLAALRAMQGRFDDAWASIARSRLEIQEFGIGTLRSMVELLGVKVETLANEPQAVERTARSVMEHSTAIGDTWYYVLASIDLARAVCDQGRPAECLRILDENERHRTVPDIEILVRRPATRALALAHLGRLDEAEPLARQAVGCANGTDSLGIHANALLGAGRDLASRRPVRGGGATCRRGYCTVRSEGQRGLSGEGACPARVASSTVTLQRRQLRSSSSTSSRIGMPSSPTVEIWGFNRLRESSTAPVRSAERRKPRR